MTAALASAPIASMTCWRHGVAPSSWPALRSCRLSPATAAAEQVTAPIRIAATGPTSEPRPRKASSTSDENRIVEMVIPETGLFDEPTRPAM